MNRQSQTLQADAQRTDCLHFGVSSCKENNNLIGEDGAECRHKGGTHESDNGGEAITGRDTVIPLGTPVEACNRLEAISEAQNDAEGEHHNLGGDTDTGKDGIGDIACQVVEHDACYHRKTRTEQG